VQSFLTYLCPAVLLVLFAVALFWRDSPWGRRYHATGHFANTEGRPPNPTLPHPTPESVAEFLHAPLPAPLLQLHAEPALRPVLQLRDFFFRTPGGSADSDIFVSEFLPMDWRGLRLTNSLNPKRRRLPFALDHRGREYFVIASDPKLAVWRFDPLSWEPTSMGITLDALLRLPVGFRGICARCRYDCSRLNSDQCPQCGQPLPPDQAA
jgi:hypothetical protein